MKISTILADLKTALTGVMLGTREVKAFTVLPSPVQPPLILVAGDDPFMEPGNYGEMDCSLVVTVVGPAGVSEASAAQLMTIVTEVIKRLDGHNDFAISSVDSPATLEIGQGFPGITIRLKAAAQVG